MMLFKSSQLIITVWVANFCFSDQSPPSGQQQVDQGYQLFEKGDHKGALAVFEKVITKDELNPSHYAMRGRCYLKLRKDDLAYDDFQTAVKLANSGRDNEKGAVVLPEEDLLQLGQYYSTNTYYSSRQYDWEKAIWCFTEAIAISESSAKYYRLRGDCHLNRGDLTKAMTDFKSATDIDGKKDRSSSSRMKNLAKLLKPKDVDEIMEDLKLLFDFIDLGRLADEMRSETSEANIKGALRLYDEVINMSPRDPEYYYGRASCHFKLGDTSNALLNFREEYRLNSYRRSALINIGRMLYSLNNLDEAIKATNDMSNEELVKEAKHYAEGKDSKGLQHSNNLLTIAIERNPTEPSYFTLRAKNYIEEKDYDRAIDDLQQAMELDSVNKETFETLIITFLNAGRLEDAATKMRLSLLDDKDLNQLGMRISKNNTVHLSEAVSCYSEALNKNLTSSTYYENRAICYRQLKKYREASSDYKDAVRTYNSYGGTINLYMSLAETWIDAGEYDEAKVALKNAEIQRANYSHPSEQPRIDAIYEAIQRMEKEN